MYRRSKVTDLNLNHRGLTCAEDIGKLNKYKRLRALRLDGNALSNLSGLQIPESLESLCLQNNQIQNLDNFPVLPHLKTFDLSNNRIDCVSGLNLPSLNELNLENNNLDVDSVSKLPKSIKILNLRNNRLADPKRLCLALSQFPALEAIDVSMNQLPESMDFSQLLIKSIKTLKTFNGQTVKKEPLSLNLRPKRSYKLKYERLTQHPTPKSLQLCSTTLPPQVDLISLSPAFSPKNWPVWDQGELGSCTAFATLSTVHYYDTVTQPSTLFQYYNERLQDGDVNMDAGSTLTQATQCLVKYGYCSADSWPYDPSQFEIRPLQVCYTQALQNLKLQDLEFECIDYSQNTIMQHLANNCPIVMGISVYASFESDEVAKTGQVPMPQPNEALLGGHAVSIVGYDTTTRKWKVRNSWGPKWGDNGYFYLPFEYITEGQLASDLWAMKQGIVVPDTNTSLGEGVLRPSAPSLSLSAEPGSPRSTDRGNPMCLQKTKIDAPIVALVTISQSTLESAVDKALETLPSTETIITSVIGILTLIQQIIQDIITITGGTGAGLTLDQKGQLMTQCSGPIIQNLVTKKMITDDLARLAISSIRKLNAQAQTNQKLKWWRFGSKNPKIAMTEPHFGMIVC